MSGLRACKDSFNIVEIDGSGPRRPLFHYSCSKKDDQGLTEPCSPAEVFCDWGDLLLTGLPRELGEKLEGNLNCNGYKVSHRMAGGGAELWDGFWMERATVLQSWPQEPLL